MGRGATALTPGRGSRRKEVGLALKGALLGEAVSFMGPWVERRGLWP